MPGLNMRSARSNTHNYSPKWHQQFTSGRAKLVQKTLQRCLQRSSDTKITLKHDSSRTKGEFCQPAPPSCMPKPLQNSVQRTSKTPQNLDHRQCDISHQFLFHFETPKTIFVEQNQLFWGTVERRVSFGAHL